MQWRLRAGRERCEGCRPAGDMVGFPRPPAQRRTGGLAAVRPNDLERAPIPAFPGALPRAQRETKRRFPAQLGADALRDQKRAAPQRLPTSRPRSSPARCPARQPMGVEMVLALVWQCLAGLADPCRALGKQQSGPRLLEQSGRSAPPRSALTNPLAAACSALSTQSPRNASSQQYRAQNLNLSCMWPHTSAGDELGVVYKFQAQ